MSLIHAELCCSARCGLFGNHHFVGKQVILCTNRTRMVIKDFDDILPYVGSFGPFQKRILYLSFPINYFLAVVYMAQIYLTLTPEHWCRVEELEHLPREIRKNLSIPLEHRDGGLHYSQCHMYDVNYSQIIEEGPLVANSSWPTRYCRNGWEFDYSDGMYSTIVSEANWVCNDNWRPNFAQSMFFAGAIVGSLLFGLLADCYGRLPTLVISNLLACAAGIGTGFSRDFITFVTCRFLVGMAYDLHYMMMYIILMEYVGPEKRTLVGNVPLAVFLTLGAVTLPWIAFALQDWTLFAIITSAPLAITILALWIVPESARWMVLRGQFDKTIDTLKKCAVVNKRSVPDSIYQEFKTTAVESYELEKQKRNNWLDLFRTPRMRIRMFLLTVVWMLLTIVYDGHVRSLSILAYNVFITNSLAGFLELPADLVPLATLDTLGRRWTCFLALAFSGMTGIATGLISQEYPLVIAVLAMIGRFFITIAMNAGLQYTVELMPTQLRGQGVSAVHITGHCATFFAPFILYLSVYHRTLPYLVLGGLSVLGGIICLLLPETALVNLPETIEDAETFADKQKFCSMPCFARSPSAIENAASENDVNGNAGYKPAKNVNPSGSQLTDETVNEDTQCFENPAFDQDDPHPMTGL